MENVQSILVPLLAFGLSLGLLFGFMGFFCSDRNADFRNVRKQTLLLCSLGGLVAAALSILFLESSGGMGIALFLGLLVTGGLCSAISGTITLGLGRKVYLSLHPVEPDSRLRPPRKL